MLALVTVLQFAENLTDRQAAGMAVRAIDWKYAIGLELADPGSTSRCWRSSGPGWSSTAWSA
ncbi:transposase [Streptomyces noursei]|uniref:transposase n=1 Tax=Streptomyces noursei TaxID=1971 RepID=UPI003825B18D